MTMQPTPFPGVALQQHAVFGECAVATQDIKAGSLVFAERPLLVSLEGADMQRLARVNPASMLVQLSRFMAFAKSEDTVQQQIMQLHCPDPEAFAGTPMHKRCAAAAAAAVRACEQLCVDTAWDEADVLRVLLIWEANSWDFLPVADTNAPSGGALFHVSCKVTHTCSAPNVVYRSRTSGLPRDLHGKGCFIAVQDIQPGQLLTVSYLTSTTRKASTVRRCATGWGVGQLLWFRQA